MPEDEDEESPFGSLDATDLDEVFEDSGVDGVQVDALKVALRCDAAFEESTQCGNKLSQSVEEKRHSLL